MSCEPVKLESRGFDWYSNICTTYQSVVWLRRHLHLPFPHTLISWARGYYYAMAVESIPITVFTGLFTEWSDRRS